MSLASSKWNKEHPEACKKAYKKWLEKNKFSKSYLNDRYRFGGNREKVLQRDNYQCVKCSITQDQHKKKFGFSLSVDHIDGKGRYSKEQNNSLDNLITLCFSCHGRKDRLRGLNLTKNCE